MRRTRLATASLVSLAVALSACGGDPAAPSVPPRFPAVAGTYRIQGTFQGAGGVGSSLSGTITLAQPSRADSALTGDAAASFHNLNGMNVFTHRVVRKAWVSEAGAVTIEILPEERIPDWVWVFTGTASGDAIAGTHTLVALPPLTDSPFSGEFTAIRR